MVKASEILVDARARVERGWCKFVGEDDRGNLCAVGALAYADTAALAQDPTLESRLPVFPYTALMEAVRGSGDYQTVLDFNDDPHTTKQDVLTAFDKAIISLEEKGL